MDHKFKEEQIHTFTLDSATYLFDVNSAKIFQFDDLTQAILKLWNFYSEKEIIRFLQTTFSKKEIERCLGEMKNLVNTGLLFQQESPPSFAFSRPQDTRVVTYTLNVVEDCNLRCRYCWNQGGRYSGTGGTYMSMETARKAIDILLEHSLPRDTILMDFYGGEPLLNFEVIKYTMDFCDRLQKRGNRSFRYKVSTNGTLLNSGIVDYLSAKDVFLGVSLDGPKEIQDLNRPFPNGKGSWDVIYANVSKVLDSGKVPLAVRATLAYPDLNMVEVSQFLRQMGFAQVEVKYAEEGNLPLDSSGCKFEINEKHTAKMREEFLRFARFYLLEMLKSDQPVDVDISNDITRLLYESPRVSFCGAGRNILCVSAKGELYPCLGFVGCAEYRLGDVDKGLERKALECFWDEVARMAEESNECKRCWARYACGKNCPANNFQYNKDFAKPYSRNCEETKFKIEVAASIISEILAKKPALLESFKPLGR